jgi:hypothetical protein
VAQALKIVGASDEIAFAVHFHQHTDFSTGVNVATDQTFRGGSLSLLLRSCLALLAQDIDGLVDVAARFGQGVAARGEACARAVAQVLHKLRRNIRFSRCCGFGSHGFTQSFLLKDRTF